CCLKMHGRQYPIDRSENGEAHTSAPPHRKQLPRRTRSRWVLQSRSASSVDEPVGSTAGLAGRIPKASQARQRRRPECLFFPSAGTFIESNPPSEIEVSHRTEGCLRTDMIHGIKKATAARHFLPIKLGPHRLTRV